MFIVFFLFLSCQKKEHASLEVKSLNEEVFNTFKNKFSSISHESKVITKEHSEKLELGRLLFNDPILSRNNDVSCATCHLSNHGFADGNSLSIGTMGIGGPDTHSVGKEFATGKPSLERGLGSDGLGFAATSYMFRNSVSTMNVKFRERAGNGTNLLRDGRFGDLNFQVLVPIHTREEMCGINPVPLKSNIFNKGKSLFKKPVKLTRGFLVNEYSGENLDKSLNKQLMIPEIPNLRLNNSQAIPNRNECLALALAKINISKYKKKFSDIYKINQVNDKHLGDVLSTYVRSHTAVDAPIDEFIDKHNNLSRKELLGLGIFFTDAGEYFKFEGQKYAGGACISCHQMPFFESDNYYSLGVRSHVLSPLTKAGYLSDFKSLSIRHQGVARSGNHNCHQKKDSIHGNGYVPDAGRALYSGKQSDCFKFKVPTLRNVIETYPYFHHGTERGLNSITKNDNLEKIAYKALKNVISHHLRGPVDLKLAFIQKNTSFLDSHQQIDSQIPFYSMQFNPDIKKHKFYPIKLNDEGLDALTHFVAYTLLTKNSTLKGFYGNDVSHPKKVLSGLPAITNDDGTQLDFK